MESNEKYLEKYFLKKSELEQKGEIWRLRVTQEEFLSEIQRLREYEIDAKKNSNLNEYHIQQYSGKNLAMTFNNHMFVNTCCKG